MDKSLELIDMLVESIKRLQDRVFLLEKKLSNYVTQEDLERFEDKIQAKLDPYLEEITDLLNSARSYRSEVDSKINKIKSDLRFIKSSLSNYVDSDEFSRVVIDILNAKSRIDELTAKVETALEKLDVLEGQTKELEEFRSDISKLDLHTTLDEITSQITTLSKALESLKKEILGNSKNISLLEAEYSKLRENQQKIEADLIPKLKSEIKQLKDTIEKELSHIEIMLSKIEHLQTLSDEDISKIKNMPDLSEIESKLASLESKNNSVNKIVSQLLNLVYDLKATVTKVSKKLADLDVSKLNYDRLEKDMDYLKNKISDIDREYNDIKDMFVSIGKDVENLKYRVNSLETKVRIENIEEVLNAFEKITVLEEEIKQLKRYIMSRKDTGSSDIDMRLRNIERAIKTLYDQQTYLLSKLNKY